MRAQVSSFRRRPEMPAWRMSTRRSRPGLKGSIGEGPNHSNHSNQSNHSNSFKIGIFLRKFKNFRKISTFSKLSAKFRHNFIKIWAKIFVLLFPFFRLHWSFARKISEKNSKITKFCKFVPKIAKKIDEKFLKYWGLSGAKACKSCRSRQELSNEYLLAKFGVDTEEERAL